MNLQCNVLAYRQGQDLVASPGESDPLPAATFSTQLRLHAEPEGIAGTKKWASGDRGP
ncbi:hypothetical protein ABID08_004474 [Rhizobium binae]|uniref:Uncharacterized protein n=1 Tax=Rhizobium binae TaxID=1138190 RepID=A0ABV2MNY9_9HYPH